MRLMNILPQKTFIFLKNWQGPRWQSGNTLASHLWGRGSIPVTDLSGKAAVGRQFTVHNPSKLYVLVSSALPTTRRDMTCIVLKAT